jgi:hypothetical protein
MSNEYVIVTDLIENPTPSVLIVIAAANGTILNTINLGSRFSQGLYTFAMSPKNILPPLLYVTGSTSAVALNMISGSQVWNYTYYVPYEITFPIAVSSYLLINSASLNTSDPSQFVYVNYTNSYDYDSVSLSGEGNPIATGVLPDCRLVITPTNDPGGHAKNVSRILNFQVSPPQLTAIPGNFKFFCAVGANNLGVFYNISVTNTSHIGVVDLSLNTLVWSASVLNSAMIQCVVSHNNIVIISSGTSASGATQSSLYVISAVGSLPCPPGGIPT